MFLNGILLNTRKSGFPHPPPLKFVCVLCFQNVVSHEQVSSDTEPLGLKVNINNANFLYWNYHAYFLLKSSPCVLVFLMVCSSDCALREGWQWSFQKSVHRPFARRTFVWIQTLDFFELSGCSFQTVSHMFQQNITLKYWKLSSHWSYLGAARL